MGVITKLEFCISTEKSQWIDRLWYGIIIHLINDEESRVIIHLLYFSVRRDVKSES
jgi:hypothetical protein